MYGLQLLNVYRYTKESIKDAIDFLKQGQKKIRVVKGKRIVTYEIEGHTQDFLKVQGKWEVRNAHLYYEGRQIVPKSDIEKIIRKYFEQPETIGFTNVSKNFENYTLLLA